MNEKSARNVTKFFSLAILALGLLILFHLASPPKNGDRLTSAFENNVGEVDLPSRWLGSGLRIEYRKFILTFDLKEFGDPSLYIPYFEQNIQIILNGDNLSDLMKLVDWKGPLSSGSAILDIPSGKLREADNVLEVVVNTDQIRFGYLSPVFFGEYKELDKHFRVRVFVEVYLKIFIFSVQAFLCLMCVVFVSTGRKDYTYWWFGASMLLACMFSLGVFSDVMPSIVNFVPELFLLSSGAGISFLFFICELEGVRGYRKFSIIALIIPFLTFAVVVAGKLDLREAVLLVSIPVSAIALSAAFVILLRGFHLRPSLDRAFLLSGLLLMIFATIHDLFVRLDLITAGVMLSQPARFLTLLGLATFLMLNLSRMTTSIEQSAETLREKLKEREDELGQAFQREKKAAQKIASQEERSRIIAELHDGVAGHLSSIVALSDIEQVDRREVQAVARNAMSELRMVIDTMVYPEGDLLMALAAYRERSINPLERLGIDVRWSMIELPEVRWMSAEETLSLLRILQEAVSNAVHHGRPTRIEITGFDFDETLFCICIQNSGGLTFIASEGEGKFGLKSMSQRAQKLGGMYKITPLTDGAKFELFVPKN